MARSYSLIHFQPGWRTINLRPIQTRLPFFFTFGALGYQAMCWNGQRQRVAYADAKDEEIFKYKRENGLLTEGYVNHYAQHLNRQ